MSTQCTLSDLPTEIHHTIFSYLDYVRDICCDQLFFTPNIEMPKTSTEFDHVMSRLLVNEEYLDFEHPNRVPFFLASKSLLKSVKSFKPTILNLSIFTPKKPCRYSLDASYMESLIGYPWFSKSLTNLVEITYLEWMDKFLLEFILKMRKLCCTDPFSRVEFVSFSTCFGRNYSSYFYVNGPPNLLQIVGLFPFLKYVIFNYNARIFPTKVQDLKIIYTSKSDDDRSVLAQNGNIYFSAMSYECKPAIPFEKLKEAFPHNYPTNIEYFLYNCIFSRMVEEANYIIDNFSLNVNLFSHIWNVQSDINNSIEYSDTKLIMEILYNFYKKYPTFRLFRFPIDNVKCLQLILSYPFVDINPSKNITKLFIETMDSTQVHSISKAYNIDFSKLGTYQFSAACFRSNNLPVEKNTADILGISTAMYTLRNGIDFNTRDKFGNNILHYLFKNGKGISHSTFIPSIENEEFKILAREPNMYGVTPNELALLKGCDFKVESLSKKFNYDSFVRTYGSEYYYQFAQIFDGVIFNEKIYCTLKDNLLISRYNYDEYKDINYRDENGKHLCHYFPNCFSQNFELLNLDLKDVVFCKDSNQTMPIQIYHHGNFIDRTYLTALDELGKLENMPKQNFFGYMDDLGMCRYLYLLLIYKINTLVMVTEADTIGFDYTSDQPKLVSLCSHYIDGQYHFTIEKSPLKKLKNIRHFGTVEGDDFSHFVVRCYLDTIRNNSFNYLDCSIMKSLIARGLRLDFVRNSEGHTAFDLIENFIGTPHMMSLIKQLRKDCVRGLTKKSKAIPEFKIKHKQIPKEILMYDSETNLILKTNSVSQYRIRIKRSLMFSSESSVY